MWHLAVALHAAFAALCGTLVALFLALVCVPCLHVPVRARLRPWTIHHVESGLEWVVAAQRLQTPWLTRLFTQSSHSVSVTFYASFLPILFWLGLPELGRNLVFLMSLALYVGNAIKDLVCAPRPLGVAYGKQKLQFLGASDEEIELNAKEYGLPSSHTLNTLCLNYAFVWYLHDRELIAPGTAAVLYSLVALWVVWIAASRLYLGLHTPIDILAGAVAGLAVLVCFISIEGLLARWVTSGPAAVTHAALVCLVLLRLYPRPLAHTPSYEFSTSFMGAMFGIVVGVAWVSPHAHQPGIQLAQVWSPSHVLLGSRLLWAARRLGVGFVAVAAMKEASRTVLLVSLPLLYHFFPLRVRALWQPPMHNLYTGKVAGAAPAQDGGPAGAAGAAAGASGEPADTAAARQRVLRPRRGTRSDAQEAGGDGRGSSGGTAALTSTLPDARRLAALPHNAHGVPWDVDVTSRFFAYAAIGVAVAGVTPRLLDALGW
ncbi:lipid phosphate phosphatase delta [Micractinium conductrix]|uniref:Lipid phosphate phosphatase delta n=1 Tax=Micractinium conductrix TaxID=554055 RepID=A0A2P6VH76_9CHLO|nr:lipid phosphate phosphatase delta [Micractinium conductrix]|eukprot:PSC73444.1 lipid phosphate phosphatase delta [Micractinium conductrix]